jgi:RNA methyltransferase, TrmH family
VGAFEEQRQVITSTANPRVKWLAGLRKRRARDADRVTLVEGKEELSLALDCGVMPEAVFVCPEFLRGSADKELRARISALGPEQVELGLAAFARVSYRDSPDGWLAVVPQPGRELRHLELGRTPLVLACEAVEKPGNLGAMLRTAEATGVDAVVAASPVSDWGNPNVVRASKGTVFAVPVAAAGAAEVADWLAGNGLTVVVATPDAEKVVTDLDLTEPLGVVVGAEHQGVSRLWLDRADHAARLPMVGRVNSLNVATAAAVILYEAVRQRNLVKA